MKRWDSEWNLRYFLFYLSRMEAEHCQHRPRILFQCNLKKKKIQLNYNCTGGISQWMVQCGFSWSHLAIWSCSAEELATYLLGSFTYLKLLDFQATEELASTFCQIRTLIFLCFTDDDERLQINTNYYRTYCTTLTPGH